MNEKTNNLEEVLVRATGAKLGAGDTRVYDFDILKKSFPIQNVPNNEYKIDEAVMPDVLDQGHISSCVACAVTVILEYFQQVEKGEYVPLSHPFIYGKHRSKDSTDYGMLVDTALKSMLTCGTVPLSMFHKPLEMIDAKLIAQKRDDLAELAKDTKLAGFCQIRYGNTTDLIQRVKLAIANTNAPLIAVSKHAFGECHCVVIYGVNEKEKKFYVQNSWGETWGNKGRAMMNVGDFDYVYLLMDEKVALPFKDVPEDAWYYKSILHMYSAGYINGKTEDTFCPDDYIKRSEVAAILDRVLKRLDEINEANYLSNETRFKIIEDKIGF